MGIWAGEGFVGHQKIDPEPADDRPFGLSLKEEEEGGRPQGTKEAKTHKSQSCTCSACTNSSPPPRFNLGEGGNPKLLLACLVAVGVFIAVGWGSGG